MSETTLSLAISNNPTNTILRNFDHTTEAEFSSIPKNIDAPITPFPESFDGRVIWKDFLSPVRNQGKCGSCWAFATTSTLADRFNIQSRGLLHIELSPTQLILCDLCKIVEHPEINQEAVDKINVDNIKNGSCQGNTLANAWEYLTIIGSCLESCIPYNKILGGVLSFNKLSDFTKDNMLPLCYNVSGPVGDMCSDVSINKYTGVEHGTPARFYRSYHYYSIPGTEKDGGSEINIMRDIYRWGPVSTGIDIYPDFFSFDPKKDIYEWSGRGQQVGSHAIQILGWGQLENKKYWIVRNSWGPEWGQKGFFYMARGTNNCKIEENVISGIPDFFYPIDYILENQVGLAWSESKETQLQRYNRNTNLTATAGGIDPTIGYTRRIIAVKPWIDFSPVIDISKLPDWKTFIAGDLGKSKGIEKFLIFHRIKKGNYLFLIVIIILIFFLLVPAVYWWFFRTIYK